MYDSIRIQNFRGIQDLTISNLGRINLLVGANNVGKTSVLEALALLHMSQNGYELEQVLEGRGYTVVKSTSGDVQSLNGAFSSMFQRDAQSFTVSGEGNSAIVKAAATLQSNRDFAVNRLEGRPKLEGPPPADCFAHVFPLVTLQQNAQFYYCQTSHLAGHETNSRNGHVPQTPVNVAPGIPRDLPQPYATNWFGGAAFFPSGVRLNTPALAKYLSTIEGTPAKSRVDAVLHELDDRFVRLAVAYDGEAAGPALNIVLADEGGTLPVSAIGDGVRRLVEFAALIPRKDNRIAFVDEIESGIYYENLGRLWRIVESASSAASVQLIATTHSWECVRAAVCAARDWPEAFRMHRIDRTDTGLHVITYDHEMAEAALELKVEVR